MIKIQLSRLVDWLFFRCLSGYITRIKHHCEISNYATTSCNCSPAGWQSAE